MDKGGIKGPSSGKRCVPKGNQNRVAPCIDMAEFANIEGVMGAVGERRPEGGEGGRGGEHLSVARQGVEHNDTGHVMLRRACQSPWDFVPRQITRGYWDAQPSYLSFIVG